MQKCFAQNQISPSLNNVSDSLEKEKILFDSIFSEFQIKFNQDKFLILKELENFSRLLQKCANKISFIEEIKNKEILEYIDKNMESAQKLNSYFQKRLNSLKISFCINSLNSKDTSCQNIKTEKELNYFLKFENEMKNLISNFIKNIAFDQRLLAIGKLKQLIQKSKDSLNPENFLFITNVSTVNFINNKYFVSFNEKAQEILNFLQNIKSKNFISNANFSEIFLKFIRIISNREMELKNEILKDKSKNWRLLAISSTNPKINDLTQFSEFLSKNFSEGEKCLISKSLTYVYVYVEFIRENNFCFGNNINSNFDFDRNILFLILFDFSKKSIQIYSKFTQKFPLSFRIINSMTDKNIFQSHLLNLEEYIIEENYEKSDYKHFFNFFNLFKELKDAIKKLKFFAGCLINIYAEDVIPKVLDILEENREKIILTNNNRIINLILNRNGIINTNLILEHVTPKKSEEDSNSNSCNLITIDDIHQVYMNLCESEEQKNLLH